MKKSKSPRKIVPKRSDKRYYETAFSASHSNSKLSHVAGPNNQKRYKSQSSPETITQPHTDEAQDLLHCHKIHEEIIDTCFNYNKEIKNQEQHHETHIINQELRENKYNMSQDDYTDYIKKYLPMFYTVQYPVSKRLISYELQDLIKEAHPDWGDFSKNRNKE